MTTKTYQATKSFQIGGFESVQIQTDDVVTFDGTNLVLSDGGEHKIPAFKAAISANWVREMPDGWTKPPVRRTAHTVLPIRAPQMMQERDEQEVASVVNFQAKRDNAAGTRVTKPLSVEEANALNAAAIAEAVERAGPGKSVYEHYSNGRASSSTGSEYAETRVVGRVKPSSRGENAAIVGNIGDAVKQAANGQPQHYDQPEHQARPQRSLQENIDLIVNSWDTTRPAQERIEEAVDFYGDSPETLEALYAIEKPAFRKKVEAALASKS